MLFHRQRKVKSLLNIAPLIDCVFLLLIFFLLTSSFMEEAGLEIELPESAYASPVDENKIIIFLSEGGALEVNGRPSRLDSLSADLQGLINGLATRRAAIMADKDVRLEMVIKVTDAAKSAGISAVSIQTIPAGSVNPSGARNEE